MWAGTCGAGDHFHVRVPKEGGRIADMGSGLGFDMIIAAKLAGADSKVVGFDFGEVMQQKAKENCEKAGN
jgi:ubiquinone/menaquinone biosynthesis C-methylase UbiE